MRSRTCRTSSQRSGKISFNLMNLVVYIESMSVYNKTNNEEKNQQGKHHGE